MANQKLAIELTALDKTHAAFGSVEKNLQGIKAAASGINGALAGLGVGLSLAGFAASIKSSVDAMDELSKASQKVGVTTEALSGLKYAAELADVSFEQLQKGLGQLAGKLDNAKLGVKDSVDLFKRLRLDANQFSDAEQALKAIADRFKELPDGIAKTAIAKDIGKAWVELIPLLNAGSKGINEAMEEARKFGIVVSIEAGRAAEEFNDNLTRLRTAATGLGISLANEVLPILVEISREMVSLNGGGANFMAGPRVALEAMTILGANVAYVFKQTGNEIGGIAAQLAALARLDFKGFTAISRMVKEDADRARKELDAFEQRILGLSGKARAASASPVPTGKTDPATQCLINGGIWDGKKCVLLNDIKTRGGGGRATQDPLASILGQTDTARLAEYTKLHDLLVKRYDAGKLSAMQYAEAMDVLNRRYFAADLAEYEQALRAKTEAEKADAEFIRDLAEATREAEQANLDYYQSIQDTEQALLDMVEPTAAALRELARLEALRDLPGINADIVNAAILKQQEAVDKALAGVEENNRETVDLVAEMWKAAAQNVEGALADFLFDPFDKGLDGMLLGFVNTLRRMAAEALAAQIMKSIFSSIPGLGFLSIPGRAIGGPVTGGSPYVVGEKGPELFVPGTSGSIVPNERLTSAVPSAPANIRIVNAYDGDHVRDYMSSSSGEQVILNAIRRNAGAVRGMVQ